MENVIEKIRKTGKADAYLLSSIQNVAYATNFSGDCSQLLITGTGAYFFTDFRYVEQARSEVKDAEIIMTAAGDRLEKINEYLRGEAIRMIGIEKNDVTVKVFEGYCGTFEPYYSYIDIAEELLLLRMHGLLPLIKPGISELDIRAELEYRMQKQGMDLAFPTIVAAGPNSACPHATPSAYKLRPGDFLTIDFGCRYQGYCSDMTRTFGIGNIDGKRKKIYDIVKYAQASAAAAAVPGANTHDVDAVARDIIAKAGYGEYYDHGTGHGVGRFIHELPVLNPRTSSILEEKMVYTVEPGIYVPEIGGVRIEDMHIGGYGSVYEFTKDLILL